MHYEIVLCITETGMFAGSKSALLALKSIETKQEQSDGGRCVGELWSEEVISSMTPGYRPIILTILISMNHHLA